MNEHKGKISVIVAVYNVAPYLVQCLDSIVNQTYRDLEILLVDDGSTDESGKICDRYAEKDERVHVIHQVNGGSSAARNTGLDAATGDYIAFADGDDWLELDAYETLVQKFTEPEIDITAAGYFMDDLTGTHRIESHLPVPETPQNVRDFSYYIYRRDEYRGVASYIWNKLFRRDFFDGIVGKIRFSVDLGSQGDDIWAVAQCYTLANKISYTAKPIYHYRQRENAAFHGAIDKGLRTLNLLRSYERIIALYERENMPDSTLDYVKRFYVYHTGLLLEYAIKIGDKEKATILRNKITQDYLEVYQRTNADHPERVVWLKNLLKIE